MLHKGITELLEAGLTQIELSNILIGGLLDGLVSVVREIFLNFMQGEIELLQSSTCSNI